VLNRTLIALLLLPPTQTGTSPSGAKTPKVRSFSFAYEVSVKPPPEGSKRLELWLPVPQDDAYQKITAMHVEAPQGYGIESGSQGNRMLHVSLKPGEAPVKIELRFDAERRERLQNDLKPVAQEAPAGTLSQYLKPDRLVPLDDQIRSWAQDVVRRAKATTDAEKARAIYDHVVATVKYDKSGKGWGRGDIYYACDSRRGNCSDFHAIFIGYSRAVGIPARFSIGFPLPAARGVGKIAGYHCWAEFYLKGVGWVPVDASEAAKDPSRRAYFFGAHDENRLQFSRGRDLTLAPPQAGEPLNFFIYPYAEVDGQEYKEIETAFEFQDR